MNTEHSESNDKSKDEPKVKEDATNVGISPISIRAGDSIVVIVDNARMSKFSCCTRGKMSNSS